MNRLQMLHAQVLMLILTVSGVCAGFWYYAQGAGRLESAARNLHECCELAARIAEAARSPRRARLETWSQDDLGAAVEKAASDAGLARERVLRIDPQAAKRLANSDYLEQATEVELSAVSLRQVVEFLDRIAIGDDQLNISTLRLRLPHAVSDSNGEELWLADIVLTQRIYAPRK